MIVDVDLVVFNCVFSRALDLNLCYIKDMISHIIVHIILFFEKKAPGRPGGFTQDAAYYSYYVTLSVRRLCQLTTIHNFFVTK